MPWTKLDDTLDGHPKVLRVGLAGTGLFARALAYCGRHLTDGELPHEWVQATSVSEPGLPEQLAEARLWVPSSGGFLIPDFVEVNGSRESILAERAKGAQRAAASRARRSGS